MAADLGITGTDKIPINYGPPNLSFTNFGGLSDGTASVNRSQTTNFTDTITYVVHRNHNSPSAFGYRRMQQNTLSYANSRGSFSFGGLLTSGFDADGKPLPEHRLRFRRFPARAIRKPARCASAIPITISAAGPPTVMCRTIGASAARLTLNLGLRYEYFSPYTELYGPPGESGRELRRSRRCRW